MATYNVYVTLGKHGIQYNVLYTGDINNKKGNLGNYVHIEIEWRWRDIGRDINFPAKRKTVKFAEFGERTWNSICSENCKKSVIFKNSPQKLDKI